MHFEQNMEFLFFDVLQNTIMLRLTSGQKNFRVFLPIVFFRAKFLIQLCQKVFKNCKNT